MNYWSWQKYPQSKSYNLTFDLYRKIIEAETIELKKELILTTWKANGFFFLS